MKKFALSCTVISFFGALVIFLVMSILLPDNLASTTESRTLTQRPVTDLTDLRALTNNWTNYVVDQFPVREKFLKAYSAFELAQHKRFVRDTYVTPTNWLMTPIYQVQSNQRDRLIKAIEAAPKGYNAKFVYAILPQKNDLLFELASPYLENFTSKKNKAELLKALQNLPEIEVIDVSDYFLTQFSQEQRKQMYYKTDFHWNAYGAFLAADYIGQTIMERDILSSNINLEQTDFLWADFSNNHRFQGDLNRRFSNLFSTKEYIPYYSCKNTQNLQYFSSVDDSASTTRGEIVSAGLTETMMNYNGLSTDNLGYYRVINTHGRQNNRVLILKDSFQNPTIDYFTELFSEVNVIDPRYYEEPYTFSQILESRNIDIVLFMYHQNNVSAELIAFLEAE